MGTATKTAVPKSTSDSTGKNRGAKIQLSGPLWARYCGDAQNVLECCVAYNEYGGYCVPVSSMARPAAQRILRGKVHEPRTIAYIAEHCGTGDIVHAGTYFGDFLPALSRACSKGAKIWAFEPNPENWLCASITIAMNSLNNIELRHAGLGNRQACLPLSVTDSAGTPLGGGSTFVNAGANGNRESVDVTMTTIDDAVPSERHVSVLQLDVEGFELPALAGAIETVRRCKPTLILEHRFLNEPLSDEILSLGYANVAQVHENTVFAIR